MRRMKGIEVFKRKQLYYYLREEKKKTEKIPR